MVNFFSCTFMNTLPHLLSFLQYTSPRLLFIHLFLSSCPLLSSFLLSCPAGERGGGSVSQAQPTALWLVHICVTGGEAGLSQALSQRSRSGWHTNTRTQAACARARLRCQLKPSQSCFSATDQRELTTHSCLCWRQGGQEDNRGRRDQEEEEEEKNKPTSSLFVWVCLSLSSCAGLCFLQECFKKEKKRKKKKRAAGVYLR